MVFFYSRRYCDGESATDKNDFIKQTNLFTLQNRPTDRQRAGTVIFAYIDSQNTGLTETEFRIY